MKPLKSLTSLVFSLGNIAVADMQHMWSVARYPYRNKYTKRYFIQLWSIFFLYNSDFTVTIRDL